MKRMLSIISAFILLAGSSLWAQAQGQAQTQGQAQAQGQAPAAAPPLTESEVIKGLKSKNPGQVISQISERGVNFDLTPEIEKQLRKAKAGDTEIDLIRKAGPTARAEAAKAGGQASGPQFSPEEFEQVKTLRDELDPDRRLQLISDFEKKYPNSTLLWYVYMFSSDAYRQKNDIDNMIALGEKSLKLNPDNLASLVTVASMIPQPQFLNMHAQEKEKYLNEADTYANRAITLIADPKTLPKQPQESDEQYSKRKNELASGAHASLGMIHLERSQMALEGMDKDEVAKAEKEYEQAIALADRPHAEDYYRLGEAYSMDSKLDQAIQAFSKAGDLGQGTVIKTYADQRIQELQKRKAQAPQVSKP